MIFSDKIKRNNHHLNLVFLLIENRFLWHYFKQIFNYNHVNFGKSISFTMRINRGVTSYLFCLINLKKTVIIDKVNVRNSLILKNKD
jgi:hypothetical protein